MENDDVFYGPHKHDRAALLNAALALFAIIMLLVRVIIVFRLLDVSQS